MKMYIYFDRNGTIKEVINDESIRRGSSDYNKIYCYLEGNPDIDDIWYLQKNPDGTLTNEVSFVDNIVTKAIPYDAKRDMKYFQDFEEYQFYVFTLSSSYLSQNGLVVATIRVAENNTLWALGELTFNVQANIVNSDNDITQSQYDYLLTIISAYYSKTEIDKKLSLKADKSDTYTKTEVNSALALKADKSDTYTKTEVDEKLDLKADKSDTYTKDEVDEKLDLKADKSDTYTKQEVNEEAISIYTYIDQVDTSLNTRVSRLDDRTLVLERDFEYLKSVQNVVDVVATYSALQSYDPTYLGIDDKVQVIADETHDGASTIYNWDGTQWNYVGAFGGNSYTKAETYNKTQIDSALSEKADKSDTYTRAVIDSMILTLSTDKADKSDTYTKTEIDGKLEEIGPMFEIVEKELEKKSTVVANPTLSGNEATLEGAEIDGIKYKVGGGGKSYLHIITISYKEAGGFCLNIKTNTNTPFTCETLISYLKELGYTSISKLMPCAPYRVGTDASNNKWAVLGAFCSNNSYLGISQIKIADGNLYVSNGQTDKDYPNFTDTVTEV